MPKPPLVSNTIRFFVLRFFPKRFRVNGVTCVMHPRDHIMTGLLFLGVYEKDERKLFTALIEPGMTVVDIGANVGIFTGIAARAAGPGGRVLAFEPEPENAACLAEMVKTNGFANVTIEQKAVSDRAGALRLYLSEKNKGDHRIAAAEEERESIEIETVRLDDVLAGSVPQVIKMDIQGAEGLACRGMTATLAAMGDGAVLLEFWPDGLRRAGTEPEEVLGTFKRLGFEGWEVVDEDEWLQPFDPAHVLGRHGLEGYANLVFVRGERFRAKLAKLRGG